VPHFFAAATAAASGDGSRGGEKMLVGCRGEVIKEDADEPRPARAVELSAEL